MRKILTVSASLACLALIGAGPAEAQQKSITVSSWGGSFQKAQRDAWFNAIEKELGIVVKEETTSGIADVRAQVASGRPTWDLSTQGAYSCALLEKEGRLEKLDPAITGDPGVPADLKSDFWISQIVYSVCRPWRPGT